MICQTVSLRLAMAPLLAGCFVVAQNAVDNFRRSFVVLQSHKRYFRPSALAACPHTSRSRRKDTKARNTEYPLNNILTHLDICNLVKRN